MFAKPIFVHWRLDREIINCNSEQTLRVNAEEAYYPSVWLRDNCQCGECWNANAEARSLRMVDLDPNITPHEVQLWNNKVLANL